jgi:hypothetical protein
MERHLRRGAVHPCGQRRAERLPWLALLMRGKIVGDVVTALELGREEWAENKALGFYCQAATACSLASAVIAWPEIKRAWGKLGG